MIEKEETKRKPIIQLFKKKEDGQSMVEFALILPLLLLLVLGIIQFGFIFNGMITVASAARDGARYGVVLDSLVNEDIRVKNRVLDSLQNALWVDVTTGDVSVQRGPNVGDDLTVTVIGTVPVVVPVLNVITGTEYVFTSQSVMRIEK